MRLNEEIDELYKQMDKMAEDKEYMRLAITLDTVRAKIPEKKAEYYIKLLTTGLNAKYPTIKTTRDREEISDRVFAYANF